MYWVSKPIPRNIEEAWVKILQPDCIAFTAVV